MHGHDSRKLSIQAGIIEHYVLIFFILRTRSWCGISGGRSQPLSSTLHTTLLNYAEGPDAKDVIEVANNCRHKGLMIARLTYSCCCRLTAISL
jgi:hypothetical protein